RILLDWLSAFYFLLQGKGKQARAILKAHKEVYKTSKQFLAKRNDILPPYDFTEGYSIVWQYFIKGNKKYNQLK
ncbi:MAG: glycosyltransferase family 2 protein, partial [Cyclobacteriaceae bacterium]|nr:glycosyltransferase family 2 protein [Cyclobacteriaceae bacterium]